MIPTSNLANVNDMDFLDPSFYDAKFVRTSTGHGFNLDLLEPGFYNAKLARVSSVWESYGVDLYENVAKVIRTNSGMDIGLLDPGFCNATLVNSYRSIEGLQEDNIIYSQNHHAEVTASTPLASAPSFLFRNGGAFFG